MLNKYLKVKDLHLWNVNQMYSMIIYIYIYQNE